MYVDLLETSASGIKQDHLLRYSPEHPAASARTYITNTTDRCENIHSTSEHEVCLMECVKKSPSHVCLMELTRGIWLEFSYINPRFQCGILALIREIPTPVHAVHVPD